MADTSLMMWGVLFGGVGIGYCVYGKKQKKMVSLVAGLLLIMLPYLVSTPLILAGAGTVLMAVPFVFRR